jgi:hypothetical protein
MIGIRAFGMIILFVTLPAICAAGTPHILGGFVLGGKIEDIGDKNKPETAATS